MICLSFVWNIYSCLKMVVDSLPGREVWFNAQYFNETLVLVNYKGMVVKAKDKLPPLSLDVKSQFEGSVKKLMYCLLCWKLCNYLSESDFFWCLCIWDWVAILISSQVCWIIIMLCLSTENVLWISCICCDIQARKETVSYFSLKELHGSPTNEKIVC